MTNETTRQTTDATNRTMSDVDHTDPHTRRPFGEHVVFARGPTVAADGGERTDGSRSSSGERSESDGGKRDPETVDDEETQDAETDDRMEDVDHEPPSETEANPVFERGREGRDDAR
ncbi:hypothetical protein ACUJ40_10120 [Halococcus saccharolyticus]|nr:hypothetical protein [Halococcus saccharolyticus]